MRAIAAILLALSLAAWSSPAHAVTVSKTYSYFTVSGSTLAEIDAEFTRRGPVVAGSSHGHPGATRLEFNTRVGYREQGGRCRVVSAQVDVDAEIILPRWRPDRSASQETRVTWSVLSADIKRHEESHVMIARNHAREMKEEILDLGWFRGCAQAERKVREVTERHLEAHERAQERFDRVEGINFERRLERLLRYRRDGGEAER